MHEEKWDDNLFGKPRILGLRKNSKHECLLAHLLFNLSEAKQQKIFRPSINDLKDPTTGS
jgi:hypothetical protein